MKFKRIVLVTNGNLASMIALRSWLEAHGSKIVRLYVTYRLPSSKSNISGLISLLVHSGFYYAFLKIWVNVIAPWVLKRKRRVSSVAELIRHINPDIEVRNVESVNSTDVLNDMKLIEPDLLISFSATHRFGDEFIASFSKGAVNVHYGALPKFAGLSPYFWHLLKQEETFGVTMHNIASQLDSGDVIEQKLETVSSRNCLDLMLDMAAVVSPMLSRLCDGDCTTEQARRQDPIKRSYFGHPAKSQVKEFYQLGNSMMPASARQRFVDIAVNGFPD